MYWDNPSTVDALALASDVMHGTWLPDNFMLLHVNILSQMFNSILNQHRFHFYFCIYFYAIGRGPPCGDHRPESPQRLVNCANYGTHGLLS